MTALGLLLFAALVPPDSARLSGSVSSTYDGTRLAGVTLKLPGIRRSAVTDSTGTFDFGVVVDGGHQLRIELGARSNGDHRVKLRGGVSTRLTVLIDTSSADLAPVVASAERLANYWGLAGFYHRRTLGYGAFFTPRDIAERHPEELADLLEGTDAEWGCVNGVCGPVTHWNGRRCVMQVRLDGFFVQSERLNDLPPEGVGGMEVYRESWHAPHTFAGGPPTPTEARVPGLLTLPQQISATACGVVLVWTRGYRWRFEL